VLANVSENTAQSDCSEPGEKLMSDILRELKELPAARLSRRIVLWVFVSVIVIEAIILIPSYNNRKQELLAQLREVTSAKIAVIMELTSPRVSDEELLDQVRKLQTHPPILGGALYSLDGKKIGIFGEEPELAFPKITTSDFIDFQSPNGSRYDVVWSAAQLGRDYTLIIRHDASSVKQDLNAFILRIAGLVVIISIFVTLGALIALKPIVVTPILKLRGDLISAGDAIKRDEKAPTFYSASIERQDELGEVIVAFMQMFNQISEAISERKQAEHSLQESLEKVEAYSIALNSELERGRQMQANFLPTELPHKPGWEISAFFEPARQVAGDFYDVFELPGDRIGLVIADVCDKGVGAALFMALFRSLIRIFSGQISQDGVCVLGDQALASLFSSASDETEGNSCKMEALEAVQLTNNYISKNHGETGMFATLFFGVLDPASGVLTYINAGHEPLYTIGPVGVKETLSPTGPAVGVMPHTEFNIQQVHLEPGDTLVGYTDGITDARSPHNQLFTKERLQLLLEQPFSSASDLLDQIIANLSTHIDNAPQDDDVTILAVRRASTAEG
jgi:sigma-B regulation protein RsbU (phosphoserine phosphatase)